MKKINQDLSVFDGELTPGEIVKLHSSLRSRYKTLEKNETEEMKKLISNIPAYSLAILAEPVRANVRELYEKYKKDEMDVALGLCDLSAQI